MVTKSTDLLVTSPDHSRTSLTSGLILIHISDEERIPAVIKAFDAGRGLIVSCSVGKKCLVPLSEITEPGQDVDIASLKRGSIVQCQLVPSRYGQFTLSLRRKV